MKIGNLSLILVISMIVSFVVCGCEDKKEKIEQAKFEHEFYQPFLQASAIPHKQIELPDYRLNVGDMLEIIFHVKHLAESEYRFHTEDIIKIQFPYHPKFNQTVTIQADGKIRLLLVGEVDCFRKKLTKDGKVVRIGKSVGELESELREKYGKYFKDPDLTITFKAANVKIEELKRAITTAPRGQSRLMPVKPDGNITLPYIKDIRAYGKTINELHDDLDEAYAQAGIPEIEVTVQILSVAPRKIFVMGEVFSPGVLKVDNMITLTQALAMAGGLTPRADRQKVLVIRRKGLPVPEGVIVDVEKMLTSTISYHGHKIPDPKVWNKDFWLDDYDLVYVPRSDLAKSNDWINQVFTKGIYSVLPFSTSIGLGFSYEIHNAPNTVHSGPTDKGLLQSAANTLLNNLSK